jgi:hypothetical protein
MAPRAEVFGNDMPRLLGNSFARKCPRTMFAFSALKGQVRVESTIQRPSSGRGLVALVYWTRVHAQTERFLRMNAAKFIDRIGKLAEGECRKH